MFGERYFGAMSDLLGTDDWPRPLHWGGFLVNFPDPEASGELTSELWHWDGDPAGKGLLVFSFYSHVRPGGGGTLVLRGSHRLIASYYASLSPEDRARPHKWHRKTFSNWDPWLAALTGHSKEPVADRDATFRAPTVVRGIEAEVVRALRRARRRRLLQPRDDARAEPGDERGAARDAGEVPVPGRGVAGGVTRSQKYALIA